MTSPKRLEFKAVDEQFISYDGGTSGSGKINVKSFHSIIPEEFIRTYESMRNRYNLSLTDEFLARFWKEQTFFGKKQRMRPWIIGSFVDFILDTNSLLEKQIKIGPLIKEFKESGDIYQLRHACSLSFLCSVYIFKGYGIQFPGRSKGRNPDFFIDGISADLKVIQSGDIGEKHRERGPTFETKLSEDLCYDIGHTIQNRLHDGIKQAQLLFIDLGARSLSGMWLNDELSTIVNIVPEPKEFRVVYFCKMGFIERTPSHSLFATYIDIDPKLWIFVRCTDKAVTHKMVTGRRQISGHC